MLGSVEFSLVLFPQEFSNFFRINLATFIFVNVLENPLAKGLQSVSISTPTDLNKVSRNLLIEMLLGWFFNAQSIHIQVEIVEFFKRYHTVVICVHLHVLCGLRLNFFKKRLLYLC